MLNEFRHSRSKNMAMGADHSSNYAFDKNIMLYIFDPKLQSLITFKSFLQDFSINFNINYEEDDTEEGAAPVNPIDFTCNYKLKLNVPSPAVNDAKINDGKFSELNRMVIGQTLIDDETQRFIDQPKRILLANLIHNGSYPQNTNIKYLSSVLTYGMPCRFSKVNWEPDLSAGFFESGRKIWPKAYSIDLDLDLSFRGDSQLPKTKTGLKRRSFSGFLPNGNYHETDIRSWPFGPVGGKYMEDFSGQYTRKKSSFIFFKFGNKSVKFKPFLDGFSFELERAVITTEGEKIYSRTPRTGNFKKSTYNLSFSVLAANILEAKRNHRNFQKLARMVCPNENDLDVNRIMKVQFANLISRFGNRGIVSNSNIQKNGVDLIAKSLTYSPIMELGFFEHGMCIYAKGYKVSLSLQTPMTDDVLEPPIRRSGFNYGIHPRSVLVTSTGRDNEADVSTSEPEEGIGDGGGGASVPQSSDSETGPREGFYDTTGDGVLDTYVDFEGRSEGIAAAAGLDLAEPDDEIPEDFSPSDLDPSR